MNQPSDTNNSNSDPAGAEAAQSVPAGGQVQQAVDPRRRLRELLSIPESHRTDPQWDEIIELEVQLAPGNRIGQETPRNNNRPGNPPNNPGAKSGGGGGGGGGFKRHGAGRKFSKAKKPTVPQ